MPCQAPAIKGATRCLKHGGRTEVPNHPSNIKRFMRGELAGQEARVAAINGHETEDSRDRPLGYREGKEFRATLPEFQSLTSQQYDEAVKTWRVRERLLDKGDYRTARRIWNAYREAVGLRR